MLVSATSLTEDHIDMCGCAVLSRGNNIPLDWLILPGSATKGFDILFLYWQLVWLEVCNEYFGTQLHKRTLSNTSSQYKRY